MSKKLYQIEGFCPKTECHWVMHYESIEEARKHNPTFKNFRIIGVVNK